MNTKIISKFELTPENWLMGDLDVDESLLEPIFRKFLNENFSTFIFHGLFNTWSIFS